MRARLRAGARRSRKEVNWEKIVDLEVGWDIRRDLSLPRRASILAEEREVRRRRVMVVVGRGVVVGVEVVRLERSVDEGGGEKRGWVLAEGVGVVSGGEARSGGSSSLRTSKISRSLIDSRQVTHFGTLLKFF